MPRILCDIDGVLANLLPEWLYAYEALGGEHVEPSAVSSYEMPKVVKDVEKCYRALGCVDYANVSPFAGASEAIARLRASGYTLRFVSYVPACAPDHYMDKVTWLTKHVPGFAVSELIFCDSKEKQFIDGDIMIEDYPRTLNEWMAAREEAGYAPVGFLIDQPYNRNRSELNGAAQPVVSLYTAALLLCATEGEVA